MPKFWVFFTLISLTSLNSILCQNEFNEGPVTLPSTLESMDPHEDMDLLMAANEELENLPEEVRRAFSEDAAVTDSVKLIDVNAPEEHKEPPRRKQPNPSLQQKSEQTCLPKLDLVFLLDTSGSIQRIYQEHVRWAVALVDSLPIEPDTVRVAAVQYAGFPLTEFALGTYPSVENIRQHLENINFRTGVSRAGYALRKAESELFRPDRGAREDAVKVIIVFTDGASIDDPQKPAQQLRDLKGVKIYVVSLKPDIEQMNRIAGSDSNIFGPNDLKRLRDVLINEAEKVRACIRIGDGYKPFKSRTFRGGATVSPQASNWLSIGQNSTKQETAPFRNDLKDIIELSRASAAISAARPGMLDEDKLKSTARTIIPQTSSSTTTRPETTTTTFMPFLGVRVIEEMEQDIFESPSSSSPFIQRVQTAKRIPTTSTTTTQQPSTKKFFKLQTEKLSSGRREFTVSATTTTQKPIPIVQNAVPLFNANNLGKTTYVPTWRRTPTTIRVPLTSTLANRPQTTRIQSQVKLNELKPISELIPQLNPAFPTLRPVQTSETTIRPSMLVTRPKISRVNVFPGVTCPHDILFIVDSSGSIQKSYEVQKAYLKDILSRIQVGNETHRVGLLQFAGYKIQKTEWTYNSHADSPTLMRAVDQIRYLTGTTFIGAALNSARQILEQRRKGIPSLVILLSDGYSQDDARRAAEQIRRLSNLEFYALSVNELSNMNYLAELVGSSQNVFAGTETEDLKHLILNRLHCRF